MKKITLIVHHGSSQFETHCECYQATNKKELKIDPNFYRDYGWGVPQFPHHELKIIDTETWIPADRPTLHIHRGICGDNFVCFPGRIESEEKAVKIFQVWVASTLYTLTTKKEPNDLLKTQSFDQFLEHMENEFGIKTIRSGPRF